jgi:GH43 family beta-xylosidase
MQPQARFFVNLYTRIRYMKQSMTRTLRHFLLFVFALSICGPFLVQAQQGGKTFSNPLLPAGADPYSIYKNGFYYYTHSTQNNLVLWKTKNLADLATAERKVVWTPPPGTMYSKELWAPEIHFINKKWYMYFAADDGKNDNHRMYVIENSAADPLQGEWIFKGQVKTPDDKWAIDGDIFQSKGQYYMIWSGWEGDVNGQQNIYIAKMDNPWTISGKRSEISGSDYEWEKHGDLHDKFNPPHVNVNEGPQFLKHNGQVFIIYSASGCWTDFYALGMLSASGSADLMNPNSWKKSPEPVFKQSAVNEVFAPGHNSFFKSPNGKEDWILYHANGEPGQGCGKNRSPRAQKFTWNKNGTPNFGIPVRSGEKLAIPAE